MRTRPSCRASFRFPDREAFERQDGIVTVEAALTLPFVFLFVLAFLFCIHLLILRMELQAAVSETVKTAAAQLALAQAAQDAARHFTPEEAGHIRLIASALADLAEPELFRDLLRRLADERLIDAGRIRIVHARLPSAGQRPPGEEGAGGTGRVELEVEYPVTIRLPFYEKRLVLRAGAVERAWFGIS